MTLSLPEKISSFLTNRRGRRYCDTCIQERLGLKWRQQVQLVTATLAVTNGYVRELDRCCICQIDRQVTSAASDCSQAATKTTASDIVAETAEQIASRQAERTLSLQRNGETVP
ncbi:MAG TPA: hypothetical protein VHU22_19380 [Xanthobacteraceae bacterium]|jgi:hypothetical protein|nr:hypothetical protein [Xanthobacteraceae bacterium]